MHVCAEPVPDRPNGICGTPVDDDPCPAHLPPVPVEGFDWDLL